MALTIKQERFCLEYLKDGNASRAYREAYDAENMKDETIWNNAYKLLQNNDVKTRVDFLRKELEDEEIMSLKDLKKFWTAIIKNKLIDDEPRINDRIKASELLAKTYPLEGKEDTTTQSPTIINIVLDDKHKSE